MTALRAVAADDARTHIAINADVRAAVAI